MDNHTPLLDALPPVLGVVSQAYEYKGFGGCTCSCGLQQGHNPETDQDFIILTELPDNPGTSVTNMVEHLATQVVRMLGLDPAKTLIFEHYPERGSKWGPLPETWALVLPDWVDGEARVPQDHWMWQHITRKEAFALMGCGDGDDAL